MARATSAVFFFLGELAVRAESLEVTNVRSDTHCSVLSGLQELGANVDMIMVIVWHWEEWSSMMAPKLGVRTFARVGGEDLAP